MPATHAVGSPSSGVSLWYEPVKRRAPLNSEIDMDIAIVGAGYTGLWTAYYLLKADPTLRVAVVEDEYVGFGASGRNGGWASAIFPVSLPRVAETSSHRQALALQSAMNETVNEIGAVLRAENIGADYARKGFVSLARSPAHLTRARATVRDWAEFGVPDQWKLLTSAESAELIGATDIHGGLFTEHCAVVHPGRLVRGLAEIVEKLGAHIYESSPALKLDPGKVSTPHGAIRASIIVRATEGFTPRFKEHKRTLVPLYSLVLATEPLTRTVRERLGLTHRTAFNDMRHLRVYAQMTTDGRMVFGGRGAPYHFGSKVSPTFDTSRSIHGKIYRTMLEFFPSLDGLEITHKWGGPLGVPRDWHPSVGLDRRSGIAWAGPYVGDGVTTSNLSGRILRNLILERDEDINSLPIVNHRSPRWEAEPLRWIGVNLGLRAAALGDAEERRCERPSRIAHLLESITGAH